MDAMHDLTLTGEARDAYLVGEVIASTAPAHETAEAAQARAALIRTMFLGFAPTTVLEAMLVCQCIALRFLAMAATRAVQTAGEDEKVQARMRAQANALHKTQQAMMARLQRMRARPAVAKKTEPAAAPDMPAPKIATLAAEVTPPPSASLLHAPVALPVRVPVPPAVLPRDASPFAPPAVTMREAMRTSTALIHGLVPARA